VSECARDPFCADSFELQPGPVSSASAEEFVRLFTRSQFRVLRFIHTLLPNLTEAEDVLQETSVILWKKWPQFERDRDFVKWACGIARLEVFRLLRQRKRNASYLSDAVLNQIADLATAEACDNARFEAGESALELCLQRLNESDRRLLKLRYQHDKTVQEIAEECGRPKSTVHDVLSRLRTRLLNCVRRRLAS
jgi:RNA polymerase sigma-70 factor (ECF subfamily)